MAELTRDETRYYHLSDIEEYPVAAGVTIYEGAAVGENGSGYARPLVAGDPFLGFASKRASNVAGVAGAERVQVKTNGLIKLLVAGVTVAENRGAEVYASNDGTFTVSVSGSKIGKIHKVESNGYALVRIDVASGESKIPELNWSSKPVAANFGKRQVWFSDIGVMGYSNGVKWTANVKYDTNYIFEPMAMWGDSLTNGVGGTPPSLFLSEYTHKEVYNGAQTGGTSTQIKVLFDAGSAYWTRPTILWVGRNNFADAATVKSDIAGMVASLGTSKFIILGVINGTTELAGSAGYNQIIALNNDLGVLYPSNYIDIRAHLVASYDPLVAQDVIDFGNDVPPNSLRSDTLHLNAAGYDVVAKKIMANIDMLLAVSENNLNLLKGEVNQSALKISDSNNTTSIEVFSNNNVGVGVSEATDQLEVAGVISSKGLGWVLKNAASTNTWRSVAYGNGMFVAVAISGTGTRVMTSPDGFLWTTRTSAADNSWQCVCYGNGLFVAVSSTGTGNRIMTSPDGITWTSRANPVDNEWYSVCYGNGIFVAVASSGTGNRVMISTDGVVWVSRTNPTDNAWNVVSYGNGLFVALSITGTLATRVMTSPDGTTWTNRTAAAANGWYGLAYGNGTWVAVSNTGTGNRIMTSPDGITWTSRNAPIERQWLTLGYGAGLFIALSTGGYGGGAITSVDGITWTVRETAPTGAAINPSWRGIAYGNGMFVAIAASGYLGCVMTSGRAEESPLHKDNMYMGGLSVNGGSLKLSKTVTAAGTTGAQNIGKLSGTVNFAAGAASLFVTNSLVDANSIVQLTVGTNDATMKSAVAVAAAGSFTIYPNANPTAETRVNFTITN